MAVSPGSPEGVVSEFASGPVTVSLEDLYLCHGVARETIRCRDCGDVLEPVDGDTETVCSCGHVSCRWGENWTRAMSRGKLSWEVV